MDFSIFDQDCFQDEDGTKFSPLLTPSSSSKDAPQFNDEVENFKSFQSENKGDLKKVELTNEVCIYNILGYFVVNDLEETKMNLKSFFFVSKTISKYTSNIIKFITIITKYEKRNKNRSKTTFSIFKPGQNATTHVCLNLSTHKSIMNLLGSLVVRQTLINHPYTFVKYWGLDCFAVKILRAIYSRTLKNNKMRDIGRIQNVSYFLTQGGAFTGLYCENGKIVVHKNFSKYVVRKKQGKRQVNKDKGGGKISSMGSQIRRNNEKVFKQKLEKLMRTWEGKGVIEKSNLIFVHCPGPYNKFLLFNEELGILNSKDYRIASVPFNIHALNYTELKKILKKSTDIKIYRDLNNSFKNSILSNGIINMKKK